MTIEEAIKHCEEVAEQNTQGLYDAIALGGQNPTQEEIANCEQCAADHRQLAEWLTELKESKRLLKEAIKDIGDLSRYCLGVSCDRCPHIRTMSRGYQCCIWQHEDEALALIGEDINVTAREDGE